jgi:hypothetical protein
MYGRAYAVAFASLLAGASVVHWLYRPDLVSAICFFFFSFLSGPLFQPCLPRIHPSQTDAHTHIP